MICPLQTWVNLETETHPNQRHNQGGGLDPGKERPASLRPRGGDAAHRGDDGVELPDIAGLRDDVGEPLGHDLEPSSACRRWRREPRDQRRERCNQFGAFCLIEAAAAFDLADQRAGGGVEPG